MAAADPDIGVGVLMFVAYRHMESRAMAALAAAGFDDLTLAQARVFQRVSPQGSRLTDLAEQAQVTKQTAGFLVDQLQQAGYVERQPDPTDARARLIRIAERGAAAIAVAGGAVAQVEAEWEAHVGKVAMRQLTRTLRQLRAITDPYR